MKKYNGLGATSMSFEQAMELLKAKLDQQDPYVMDLLFDIVMDEQGDEHEESDSNTVHHRA